MGPELEGPTAGAEGQVPGTGAPAVETPIDMGEPEVEAPVPVEQPEAVEPGLEEPVTGEAALAALVGDAAKMEALGQARVARRRAVERLSTVATKEVESAVLSLGSGIVGGIALAPEALGRVSQGVTGLVSKLAGKVSAHRGAPMRWAKEMNTLDAMMEAQNDRQREEYKRARSAQESPKVIELDASQQKRLPSLRRVGRVLLGALGEAGALTVGTVRAPFEALRRSSKETADQLTDVRRRLWRYSKSKLAEAEQTRLSYGRSVGEAKADVETKKEEAARENVVWKPAGRTFSEAEMPAAEAASVE